MEKSNAFASNEVSIPVYGIDLGTTNSAIACVRSGTEPTVLKMYGKDGNGTEREYFTMPSVVMWKDGKFIVGREAYEHSGEPNVCASIKRIMEEPLNNIDGTPNPKATFTFVDGDKSLTMTNVEISAEILKGLVDKVSDRYFDIHDVVVTTPAYFNSVGRSNTVKAAKLAGLNNIAAINEPTAAALCYDTRDILESDQPLDRKFVVYDLGGGTFDVSLIHEYKNNNDDGLIDFLGLDMDEDSEKMPEICSEVLDVGGDSKLGGDDIDRELARLILEKIGLTEADVDPLEFLKLKFMAETCKKESVYDFYSNNFRGKEYSFGPELFEKALRPSYEKAKVELDKVLSSPLAKGCDTIYLVGGSTKHPMLQKMLKRDYPNMTISNAFSPDLSVACGAAIKGHSLKFSNGNVQILDIVTQSIGFSDKGVFKPILRKGTTLPTEGVEFITNPQAGQTSVHVELYQGEKARIKKNTWIGTIEIPLEKPTEKEEEVDIMLKLLLTSDNMLKCVVTDRTNPLEPKQIEAKYDLRG